MKREIEYVSTTALTPHPKNSRTHPQKQLRRIANSISKFGFTTPIGIDENNVVLAGHGRLAAAKLLSLGEVPCIRITGLSEAKKRAYVIADNKIAEGAGTNRKLLAEELAALPPLLLDEGLDLDDLGFDEGEVEALISDHEADSSDPGDEIDPRWIKSSPTTQLGDLWQLGDHNLTCGDCQKREVLARVLGGRRIDMLFCDPPYNARMQDIGSRGHRKHSNFVEASGEKSSGEFRAFLKVSLQHAAESSKPGAVHFVFMDWRQLIHLLQVGEEIYGALLNLAVWVKSTAGQGSFYRSQHELVAVFRCGQERHLNNIQLGRFGRNRSNVWSYPAVNNFKTGPNADLSIHPTVKPVALIAEAIKDSTRRGELVVDIFCGSGTTILAAERVGRVAAGIEISAQYVDATVRRWQAFTGRDAVLAETGQTFEAVRLARLAKAPTQPRTA